MLFISRTLLAALHYNENSNREQAVTADGRIKFALKFPRHKKGGYSVRKERTKATYGRSYLYYVIQKLNKNSSEAGIVYYMFTLDFCPPPWGRGGGGGGDKQMHNYMSQ